MELLDPKTSTGKKLGYLALRLATIDAERTSDRAGLRRSLEGRIAAVVKRSSVQGESEQRRTVESTPLTAEQARLRSEVLKASL